MAGSGTLRVRLARPRITDCEPFLERVRASRSLHRPWVYPPTTPSEFERFLGSLRTDRNEAFLLRLKRNDDIAGVLVLSEITRGILQSAYLGFYAMVPHDGRGYMHEGLRLIVRHAMTELRLHRVEANIQPQNERSIRLVRDGGFRREGYSPRYLKIGGRWRDHERWAILAEDWRVRRS